MPEIIPPLLGAPPSRGVKTASKIVNVMTPEEAADLQRSMGKSTFRKALTTSASSQKKASRWLVDTESESGRFVAVPLSMLELRKSESKLTLSEILVLAYIHGFQRKNQLGSCRAKSMTVAETLNMSNSSLSKHLKKLKKLGLVERTGHGEEGAFRVIEKEWARQCDCPFDLDDSKVLHEWTSKGKFCRVPLWAIKDDDLTALDKLLFGLVFSFFAGKESLPFSMSTQNAASNLGVSKSKLCDSLKRLTNLGLIKKTVIGPRIPAEYRIDSEACFTRGKKLIK